MRVPNSYNFNAIVESGFYSWTNGGTSNFPVGCAAADLYALQVEASPDGTGIIYQRLVDFTTGPTSALYTWERQSVNAGAAWTPWIATNIPGGYSNGIWTPTLIGSTTPGAQTYILQSGSYIKIGRLVFCSFRVTISAKDAAMAGDVRLGGLPFVIQTTNDRSGVSIAFAAGITLSAGYTCLAGYGISSLNMVALSQFGSGLSIGFVPVANLAAAVDIAGSFSYIANA
jgi:hypothetical protein